MFKVASHQISDNIDLESFAAAYTAELLYSDHIELFYEAGTEIYISVFKYGVICFFNCDNSKISEFVKLISNHCNYFDDSELTKEYQIEIQADELKFGFNKAEITYFDIDTARLVMLNVAQSVSLDYYFQKGRVLLEETNKHTSFLEKSGNLAISDKELKKFIGKTHNLKNHIVENLHILDSVPNTRQNDYLIKIDSEMKTALFMEKRFENIAKELEIIREHLDYFSNLINHGNSMKLEWIIIVLLAIFVINIFVSYLN